MNHWNKVLTCFQSRNKGHGNLELGWDTFGKILEEVGLSILNFLDVP